MAIIEINEHRADVQGLGVALDATVNFSGALMEMLATTYTYILMASIREPIQNGCDAVKRAGLTFADGVMLHLPTPSNPVVTVVDKGSGMTKAFMESPDGYLSFGTSTKADDDGSAGGLGVGRWAAYGYIRECYITTCHASDMISRTYFQFQGENGKPRVQLASEVPGTEVGTRVSFPVKESDIEESYRAAAWLKGVMQLTMGDSFSVDAPHLLPKCWPDASGIVLELETVDPGLKGVRVYPMKGAELKYNRQGLQAGSLVVLTNQERGIGGLPFHVQAPTADAFVFASGMVFEIPMSFRIPFMPSREEIKYTDEVNALLTRIGKATNAAGTAKAKELYDEHSLSSKAVLMDFLGFNEKWHYFSLCASTAGTSSTNAEFSDAIGRRPWTGEVVIPFPAHPAMSDVTIKWASRKYETLKRVFRERGLMTVSSGKHVTHVSFPANSPITLVVNDLVAGGASRFQEWLHTTGLRNVLFISAANPSDAVSITTQVNSFFGGALDVIPTSKMATARSAPSRGTGVIARSSKAGILTYHCFSRNKQDTEALAYDTASKTKSPRIWLDKNGGALGGFSPDVQLSALLATGFRGCSISAVMDVFHVKKLYLLTSKQTAELLALQAEVKAEGWWDADDAAFDALPDGETMKLKVEAIKSWMSFEDAVSTVLKLDTVQATLNGSMVQELTESWDLNVFCETLAKAPRFVLTGTSFDKALSPFIDLVSCDIKLHRTKGLNIQNQSICRALVNIGKHLQPFESDSAERAEMLETLKKLATVGVVNYEKEWLLLQQKFPLLKTIMRLNATSSDGIDHLCLALAKLYP